MKKYIVPISIVVFFLTISVWLKINCDQSIEKKEIEDFKKTTTLYTLSAISLVHNQEASLKETLIHSIATSLIYMENKKNYNLKFFCEFWEDKFLKESLLNTKEHNFYKVVNKLKIVCEK
jgi:hypothetical protein